MNPKRSTWELSPYELHRVPQTIPEDGQEIKVTPRFLESELSCAICLDILRNTRTTKECLHRFCDECISQALRSGNKECPNCRSHLASMRSLRRDPLFDALIATIFPNRAELDKQQSQILAHLTKSKIGNKMLSSIEEGKRHQAQRRGRGPRNSKGLLAEYDFSSVPASMSATTSEAGSALGAEELREASETADSQTTEEASLNAVIGLEIIPHSKQMKGQAASIAKKWKRRYVKVKACATVAHLSRFVLSRLIVERTAFPSPMEQQSLDIRKLSIYVKLDRNVFQLMDPHVTLKDIQQQHSRGRPYITLAFAITGNLKSA